MHFYLRSLFLFVCFFAASVSSAKIPAIIFDIDGTLVDNGYRSLEALRTVGYEMKIPALLKLEYSQVSSSCSETCKKAGVVPSKVPEICGDAQTLFTSPWGKLFLSSPQYVKYDHVITGAPDFVVRAAKETHATLVYLTGRETLTRQDSTQLQLLYYGFPLEGEGSQLITRGPKDSPVDFVYKKAILKGLQERYTIVGVFDDNLENANMFRDALSADIPIVRPTKNVANKTGVMPGIEQITNYLFNESRQKSGKRTVTSNQDQLNSILGRIKAHAEVANAR